MLKNILHIDGVQPLNADEQKSIQGGFGKSRGFCCEWCPDGSCLDYVDSPSTTCPFAAACPS
ncbi:hypothetical protein [uncultured Dokdonia sp.]|uniref:hypothetical protein n=1 Tax=uncultured Dokdonia sp. TaxID=575653 RepID=UPI002609EE64|nr:hypothetical protein [uncultured Dokdonia sp.]